MCSRARSPQNGLPIAELGRVPLMCPLGYTPVTNACGRGRLRRLVSHAGKLEVYLGFSYT